jgi:hypothetical protein
VLDWLLREAAIALPPVSIGWHNRGAGQTTEQLQDL